MKSNREKNNLIAMGLCSVVFLIANQIAVEANIIDPFIYFLALLGGGGALVLSVGEIIAQKAEQRLNEIEQEESKENSYTPKL
jgi:hypothetical protein